MDNTVQQGRSLPKFSFIALAMGLMLSPETLTILGNSVGEAGTACYIIVLSAASIHLLTVLSYGQLFSILPGPDLEIRVFKEALGSILAMVLPVCSKVLFAVCAATGILATAGYIFNEVFVIWFPNLGFSFCLLGFLLVVNLLGKRIAMSAQVIFVAVILLGLLLLSLAGLLELGNSPSPIATDSNYSFKIISVMPLGLLLFIGFDLVAISNRTNGEFKVKVLWPMASGIVLAGLTFCIWGFVSMQYVALSRLADTTIPYTITARTILGQTGRIVMGVVILAGACSAVNALFISVSRMMADMATEGLMPSFMALTQDRALVPLFILVLGTAAMLAFGMAGEPKLDVFTRAGLWFWLLNYTAIHFVMLILARRSASMTKMPGYPGVQISCLILLCFSLLGILWFYDDAALLLKIVLAIFTTAFLASILWNRFSLKKDR